MAIVLKSVGGEANTTYNEFTCDLVTDIANLPTVTTAGNGEFGENCPLGSTCYCYQDNYIYILGTSGWKVYIRTNEISNNVDTTVTNVPGVNIMQPTDYVSGYIVAETPEHYALHRNGSFSITKILPNIGANGVLYIELITPVGMECTMQMSNLICNKYIKSEFFEAPTTITDGTVEIPIIQRMRTHPDVTAHAKLYLNPTNITGGTLLRELVWGNVGGQGNQTIPLVGVADSTSINFAPGTKYYIKITNMEATATTILFWSANLFEFD